MDTFMNNLMNDPLLLSLLIFGVVLITSAIVLVLNAGPLEAAYANAKGEVAEEFYYSKSHVEASAHLKMHSQMQSHADGKPFYCNTFTGWGRKVYDICYFQSLKSNQRKHDREKAQEKRAQKRVNVRQRKADRAHSQEVQRVEHINLEARVVSNLKQAKK